MAGWWLSLPMLAVLARLNRGETLILDSKGRYTWKADRSRCSGTAKAMVLRGLIYQVGMHGEMSITNHGANQLHSNRFRVTKALEANVLKRRSCND